MTDCTLEQYYGITEEKLGQLLEAEAKRMFSSDSLDSEDMAYDFYLASRQKYKKTALIFRYWERMKSFIGLPVQIVQKHFQT